MKKTKQNKLSKDKKVLIRYLVTDTFLFFAVFHLAYAVYELNIAPSQYKYVSMLILSFPCIITTVLIMLVSNIYRTVWRYASTMELLRLLLVSAVSLIFGMFYRGLFTFAGVKYNVPNALVVMAYMFFFLLATLYRLSERLLVGIKHGLRIRPSGETPPTNIIIYGAGYTGATLAKRLVDNPSDGFCPVAFIDDDPGKKGKSICDVKIEGDRNEIKRVIEKYDASAIAIAITNMTKQELRDIFDFIKLFNIRIMVASGFKEAQSEINSDIISIRNIKIEDLLHRNEHTLNMELIDGFIKDKVIMVTGGAGSIGSELCRQALLYGCKRLVIFDRHENGMFELNEELKYKYKEGKYFLEIGSVQDKKKLKEVMDAHRPDVVFHAAAYKHVPMMELAADESVKNNVFGTKNVIEQCNESGVRKFILISTDKAINPANVMGATKRTAELYLQASSKTSQTRLAAVRFGNVLGSSGSVIPTFIKQINAGGPVTVTARDMRRYFMTIPEAVRLVMQAGALANGGEVFVLDMGDPVYIYDLAQDLIRMSGLVPEKDIKIEIIGRRRGEKDFEELQYGDERVDKTVHKDIFVCKLAPVDAKSLNVKLKKLLEVSSASDKKATEDVLFEIVPSKYREKSGDEGTGDRRGKVWEQKAEERT